MSSSPSKDELVRERSSHILETFTESIKNHCLEMLWGDELLTTMDNAVGISRSALILEAVSRAHTQLTVLFNPAPTNK